MCRRPTCPLHQYALKANPHTPTHALKAHPPTHRSCEPSLPSPAVNCSRFKSIQKLRCLHASQGSCGVYCSALHKFRHGPVGDAALLTVSAPSSRLAAKELPASASGTEMLKSCNCRAAPVLSSYISIHTMCAAYPCISLRTAYEEEKRLSLDADHETPSGLLLAAACLSHVYGHNLLRLLFLAACPAMGPICPARARHVPSSQVPLGRCMHSQEHRETAAGRCPEDHTSGERRHCHGHCLPGNWEAA